MALKQEVASMSSRSLGQHFQDNAPLAVEDDEDDFEDAIDEQASYSSSPNLQLAFNDCEVAITKFFNNDLEGALYIMRPWCSTSLYHSLGISIFEFIPAMLTVDQCQINRAQAALKTCITICNQYRRNYTFVETLGTMIRKPNYCGYTDVEAHAELCYAEALLLQAAMTIMDGEDLTGFIKGTLKIKSCYNSYKDCAKILDKKKWQSEESRIHFQSGVRLGIATFNVMISLLPPKIISLLEFVGFSGNKVYGLIELEEGSKSPGLRSVLCDLTLLAYHLVICHFIGAESNIAICEEILSRKLTMYPDGVWFLVFKGRLELLKGMFSESLITYNKAMDSQNMWKQFTHLCFWEIMWINGLTMEWREAASYALRLIEESSWSRTIYSYTRAAMLLQLGSDITSEELAECNILMRDTAYYKQRIAGKSLPTEKFMIKRAARYQAQGGLVLPALELLCLWNMFPVLVKNDRAAQNILKMIETHRSMLDGGAGTADNRALVRYLHGCCLAAMHLPRLAMSALSSVLSLKNDIKEDTFLLPYSLTEMAMCHYYLGEKERAVQLLQEARKKYSGYSLESRLHFRIHSKIQLIKASGSEPLEDSSNE